MESAINPPAPAVGQLPAEDAILALLMCPDETAPDGTLNFLAPINGRTRLMKELFLISVETEAGQAGALGFKFTAGPYGPSAYDVQHSLEDMTASREVLQEKEARAEGFTIRISPQAYSRARKVWTALPPETALAFYSIKSKFNETPLGALLFYVYSRYPEYTVNSRIRDGVLGSSA